MGKELEEHKAAIIGLNFRTTSYLNEHKQTWFKDLRRCNSQFIVHYQVKIDEAAKEQLQRGADADVQ